MREHDWIGAFAQRANIRRRDVAERSAQNIAHELGGSLTWGESRRLASELPEPIAGALRLGSFGTAMARFSAPAFVDRIAERDGVGVEEARRRASAFLSLLHERLLRSEVQHLAAWRTELAIAQFTSR